MPCRRPSHMDGRRPHLRRAIAAWRRQRARRQRSPTSPSASLSPGKSISSPVERPTRSPRGAALGKSKTAIRRFPETLGGAQLAEGDAATGHPTRTIRCLGAADQQMGTRLSLAGCTATISWLRQIGASSHRGIAEASGSHSNRALPTRAMSRNSNQGSGGGSAA